MCTFIGMKHISPTFMYIIPMYVRLTTFTKTLSQMSFHLYFLLFLFRSGAPPMTLLTAGALTDHQLPATAPNVCMTDARLGSVGRVPPPNKNPGFADELWHVLQRRVAAYGHLVEGCLACRTRAPPAALPVGCGWRRSACVTAQYPRTQ